MKRARQSPAGPDFLHLLLHERKVVEVRASLFRKGEDADVALVEGEYRRPVVRRRSDGGFDQRPVRAQERVLARLECRHDLPHQEPELRSAFPQEFWRLLVAVGRCFEFQVDDIRPEIEVARAERVGENDRNGVRTDEPDRLGSPQKHRRDELLELDAIEVRFIQAFRHGFRFRREMRLRHPTCLVGLILDVRQVTHHEDATV